MKKVLVIEDDQFLSNAYRIKLSKAGYETKICLDGEEALASFPDFTPDLIILDLVLPGIDGFGVLNHIKTNEKYKQIPVIIASNLGQHEEIDKGLKMGAADYIVKSDLTMDQLLDKIRLHIK